MKREKNAETTNVTCGKSRILVSDVCAARLAHMTLCTVCQARICNFFGTFPVFLLKSFFQRFQFQTLASKMRRPFDVA